VHLIVFLFPTISDGLNNFKSFQEQLLEIEKQLNTPKEEGK
jgi:hypothetical protein